MAEASLVTAPDGGERPDLGKLMLRADQATAEAAGRALGLALPGSINAATAGEALRALRLGPDEYWLVLPRGRVAAALAALEDALADQHRALVDISARLVVVEITGPHVRDTLAAACPLDLHPAVFGPNQATRTVFGKAEIVLNCLAPDQFRLLVNRSFAPYVQALLAEAGREFRRPA
jgi:sarcosine oxidase subunit gamma